MLDPASFMVQKSKLEQTYLNPSIFIRSVWSKISFGARITFVY